MIDWLSIDGLDWGVGNSAKNETHLVSFAESEQTFFNEPLLLLSDAKHSQHEPRYHVWVKYMMVEGYTSASR
jgi:uncharacterized DUF497 family protein